MARGARPGCGGADGGAYGCERPLPRRRHPYQRQGFPVLFRRRSRDARSPKHLGARAWACARPRARQRSARECGTGFTCRDTTLAGDRQCVSDRGCANGANLCASDADCTRGACRAGPCVGLASGDAGADASDVRQDAGDADGGSDAASIGGEPGERGCHCVLASGRTSSSGPLGLRLIGVLALALTLRRRA